MKVEASIHATPSGMVMDDKPLQKLKAVDVIDIVPSFTTRSVPSGKSPLRAHNVLPKYTIPFG